MTASIDEIARAHRAIKAIEADFHRSADTHVLRLTLLAKYSRVHRDL